MLYHDDHGDHNDLPIFYDPAKSQNGFSLSFAKRLFTSHEVRTEEKDDLHNSDVQRFHMTGFVDGKLITVSYTTRFNEDGEEVIR